MEIVPASQQQVDRAAVHGSDPASSLPCQSGVTPEGIVVKFDYTYGFFEVESNNGAVAVVKVSEGPIAKVYLERLIRQDETGIWTVVGYDPR